MYKNVFISYAKEDITTALEIYDFLSSEGFNPWLDKKNIRLGFKWEYAIKKALREANFIILLLSSKSVNKRGYVQKEFKTALDYAEYKLPDDTYLVPILLDDCTVPEALLEYQWVKINEENFKEDILNSLKEQHKKYVSSIPKDIIDLNKYGILYLDLNSESKNGIEYNCAIPTFLENNYFDANFINSTIQNTAIDIINDYSNLINEIELNIKNPYYLDIGHNVSYISKNLISLSLTVDSYFGQAHPSTTIYTFNFNTISK